jgi:hypothetical protein
MKNKLLYILCILIVLALSACGGEATPTINVTDMQNTAIANAWLAMTQTQAAMPTATATFTPIPTQAATPTFIVIPTLPLLQPAQPTSLVPQGNPTTNPCYDPPPAKPKGTTVLVKFLNKSDAIVTSLSFGMEQPNKEGECFTYSFPLGRYDAPVVRVLAGCYWAYAYTDHPSTAASPQSLCVFDTTKTVSIWVTKDVINFH